MGALSGPCAAPPDRRLRYHGIAMKDDDPFDLPPSPPPIAGLPQPPEPPGPPGFDPFVERSCDQVRRAMLARDPSARVRSRIDLPRAAGNEHFARFVPFGDGREIVVLRGKELGKHHGLPQGSRRVRIERWELPLERSMTQLSPPPLMPGQQPMSWQAAKRYQPEMEVLYLPDAEVLIHREPDGFSDAEVQKIVAAITLY